MYSHILVPLDGSPLAERALSMATLLARRTGGSITLVRAVPIPSVASSSSSWIERDRIAASAYLTRIAGMPELSGIAVKTHVLMGAPAAAVLDTAEAVGADVIVISSHGRAGPATWLSGSVAEQVAHHAKMPVLVLRAGVLGARKMPSDATRSLRVLVPLDGSTLAESALEPAAAWLAALAVPEPALHLVLALAPTAEDTHNMPEVLALEGARAYLSQVADRMRAAHPQLAISWTVTARFDVAEAVIRAAGTGDRDDGDLPAGTCDAIAMATHGRSGITRWVLGSITERVLHATNLPLLIVRPTQRVSAQAAVLYNEGAASQRLKEA